MEGRGRNALGISLRQTYESLKEIPVSFAKTHIFLAAQLNRSLKHVFCSEVYVFHREKYRDERENSTKE